MNDREIKVLNTDDCPKVEGGTPCNCIECQFFCGVHRKPNGELAVQCGGKKGGRK